MKIDLDQKIKCLPFFYQPTDESILLDSPFTWREALMQKRWGFCVFPSEEQRLNIMYMAYKMTQIIETMPLAKIQITSWLRSRPYNIHIGGSFNSAHIEGKAVDFQVLGARQSVVRERLSRELDRLELRLERLPESAEWCHVDSREPGPSGRYFNP